MNRKISDRQLLGEVNQ